jgi:regulator of replication initiation timing
LLNGNILNKLAKLLGSITACFGGYFSFEKFKEVKLINVENQSPFQFNLNQFFRDAIKESKNEAANTVLKTNQELSQENTHLREIIAQYQATEATLTADLQKAKGELATAASSLKNLAE